MAEERDLMLIKSKAMQTDALKLNRTEIKYTFLNGSDDNWLQLMYTIIPEEAEPIKEQIETIEKAEVQFFDFSAHAGHDVQYSGSDHARGLCQRSAQRCPEG